MVIIIWCHCLFKKSMCHLVNYLTHYVLVSFVVYRPVQNTWSLTTLLNPPTLRHLHKFLVHHYQLRILMAEIAVRCVNSSVNRNVWPPLKGQTTTRRNQKHDKKEGTINRMYKFQENLLTRNDIKLTTRLRFNYGPSCSKADSTIHRINHHPVDKYQGNQLRYPADRDLPGE